MGLLDSAASTIGLGGGDSPVLKKAQTDPNTQRLLDNEVVNNTMPIEIRQSELQDQGMAGTQAPRQLLTGGSVPGQEGMNEALQKRQDRQFDSENNRMSRGIQANSLANIAGENASLLSTVRGESQAAANFASKQALAAQNAENSRNNAITSLLGGVGAVTGAGIGSESTDQNGNSNSRLGAIIGQQAGRSAGPGTGKISYVQ
jgi:hypothetical protein